MSDEKGTTRREEHNELDKIDKMTSRRGEALMEIPVCVAGMRMYDEVIEFKGKAITLRSLDGRRSSRALSNRMGFGIAEFAYNV